MKLKTILVLTGIILFYVFGIILFRSLPFSIREELAFSCAGLLVIVITVCIAVGSYLSPCSSTSPRNKKEKFGDTLCDIAFALRFVLLAFIPFFFAGIIS